MGATASLGTSRTTRKGLGERAIDAVRRHVGAGGNTRAEGRGLRDDFNCRVLRGRGSLQCPYFSVFQAPETNERRDGQNAVRNEQILTPDPDPPATPPRVAEHLQRLHPCPTTPDWLRRSADMTVHINYCGHVHTMTAAAARLTLQQSHVLLHLRGTRHRHKGISSETILRRGRGGRR